MTGMGFLVLSAPCLLPTALQARCLQNPLPQQTLASPSAGLRGEPVTWIAISIQDGAPTEPTLKVSRVQVPTRVPVTQPSVFLS